MPRLICVFIGRIVILMVLSCGGSYVRKQSNQSTFTTLIALFNLRHSIEKNFLDKSGKPSDFVEINKNIYSKRFPTHGFLLMFMETSEKLASFRDFRNSLLTKSQMTKFVLDLKRGNILPLFLQYKVVFCRYSSTSEGRSHQFFHLSFFC